MTNEVIKQEFGCALGCSVSGWDGLSLPCKMVHNYQNVLVTTSRYLKRQKVHVNQIHRICGINDNKVDGKKGSGTYTMEFQSLPQTPYGKGIQ